MTREERVTLEAFRSVSPIVEEAGGAVVLRCKEAPDSPMLNRILGLGLDAPATEDDVDAALAAVPAGTVFYVALAPSASPPELGMWLEARGLEPGRGWMGFRRGVDPVETRASPLRLHAVRADDDADAFARVVCAGYGMPDALEAMVARAPRVGWRCFIALDGEEPASAAALFVSEGAGYLGFAATLEEHRGKGAQSLLLAERIRLAAELGCDIVLTETGERRDDRPSDSYRNILRTGFQEVAVTANWLGRA